MRDDKTSRGWPLPYKTNTLADDVERIRTAFNSIDAELSTLEENISQNLIENLDQKLADLEAKLEAQDFGTKYGFYIDDDGDLCQDTGSGGGESTTPQNPENIATDDEVSAMLDEIYNN